MDLAIRRVSNGYVVDTYTNGEGSSSVVIEEGDSEAQAVAELLRYVADQFTHRSRHSDECVYVIVHPGDKNDDYDPNFDDIRFKGE